MSKKLGHFIIQCDTTSQLHTEHELLEKKLNEGYFNETILNNLTQYSFSHIFVQDISIANFKKSGQPYMKLNLHVDIGDRYEKNDIEHFRKLVEYLLKRDIRFSTYTDEIKGFFENKPILYDKTILTF